MCHLLSYALLPWLFSGLVYFGVLLLVFGLVLFQYNILATAIFIFVLNGNPQ